LKERRGNKRKPTTNYCNCGYHIKSSCMKKQLFLLRSLAREAQFDLALVKLRKIEIYASADMLEEVN